MKIQIRILCLLTALSLSVASIAEAKRFTIDTAPEKSGRVYVDGKFVGIAPVTMKLKLKKHRAFLIHAEKEGALSHWPTEITKGHKGVIRVRLEADEAYDETEESDIANNWLAVEARHTTDDQGQIDEERAWQKIVSIVTDRFSDLEQVDRSSFYLRSAWRLHRFPYSTLRHRIVVKRGVARNLAVKVQIESQIFIRSRADEVETKDKFLPHSRIFGKDAEIVRFIRDQL